MCKDILFRVTDGSCSYVESGEVFKQVSDSTLEEVVVAVYGHTLSTLEVDNEYSSPHVRKEVGELACTFVDLLDKAQVNEARLQSVQMEIAVDRLSKMYPNRTVAIVTHSRIHIGADKGTGDMVRNIKAILGSVADQKGMFSDVIVWWYLNDAELKYLVNNSDILPEGSEFLADCQALVVR